MSKAGGQAGTAETEPDLLISADGQIVTITLNRPAKLNALTPAMQFALHDALDHFATDPVQRVAIIAANGRAFCAGSDLKSASERFEADEVSPGLPPSGYAGLASRFDLDKPVIAAVSGDAVGGGFELALACDFIVAAQDARFALPEPHLGMVAIGGGPHRLARSIGTARAKDIVMTGRWVGAQEALEMGFVNRVTARDSVDQECRALAADILRSAPGALAASKQLVDRTLDRQSLAAAIADQNSFPAMKRWRASDETRQGARAFSEKRKPDWTGP